MNQQTNHQTKVKNLIMGFNGESLTGALETFIQLKPETTKSNTILVQNIGKDPPGWWRSPEEAFSLSAENRPVLLKSNKTLFNFETQIFKQIQNPNIFYN